MTIPIVPGPFSFLAEAGHALGEFDRARTTAQQEARKGVETLQNLIQLGVLPAATLESETSQHLFSVAGLPPVQAGGTVPQPKEKVARMQANALDQVQPGTPQERAVTGIPSQQVATTGEQATIAGSEAKTAEAAATTANSRLQEGLSYAAGTLLGKDPKLARLAAEMAVPGMLHLRIAELQNARFNLSLARQEKADNLKILLEALDAIPAAYEKEAARWDAAAQQGLVLANIDPKNSKEVDAFYTAFARNNPKPTPDAFSTTYLKTYLHMDAAQFQQRLTDAMDEFYGHKGTTPPTGLKTSGAPAPYARPGGHKNKVDMAVATISARVRANPAGIQELIHQLRDAYQQKAYTSLEVRSILARSGLLDQPLAKDFLREIGEQ